jgi:hypothetical protein
VFWNPSSLPKAKCIAFLNQADILFGAHGNCRLDRGFVLATWNNGEAIGFHVLPRRTKAFTFQ